MPHYCTQYREALVARLKDKVPLVQGRVFASRPFGLAPHESLCIILFTPSDSPALAERGRSHPQRRDVVANLMVHARDIERADDELEAVCAQVDAALADWKAVHPALEDHLYARTQIPVVEGKVRIRTADKAIGLAEQRPLQRSLIPDPDRDEVV